MAKQTPNRCGMMTADYSLKWPLMMTKDQRYSRIAKACLRAINQTSTNAEDRAEDIRRVYEAIDAAFRQEILGLEQELTLARVSLQHIAKLEQDMLHKAPTLASDALAQMTDWSADEAKH